MMRVNALLRHTRCHATALFAAATVLLAPATALFAAATVLLAPATALFAAPVHTVGAVDGTNRRGPYLGESPPNDVPALFAPGFVSTGLDERDGSFSPDGSSFFYTIQIGRFEHSVIMETHQENGRWTQPAVAAFSGTYLDLEAFYTPDGQAVYFASNRPPSGAGAATDDMNIWRVTRDGDRWRDPVPLAPQINSPFKEFFPSPAASGTLYFCRENADGRTSVFSATPTTAGGFNAARRLPDTVNRGTDRFNAFVAPDESYLIVCVYGCEESVGGIDYFVSFRGKNGDWAQAVPLGKPVSTSGSQEYSASVTPDGKYLFFMSSRTTPGPWSPLRTRDDVNALASRPGNGSADIYWVSSSVLHSLRP